MRTGLSSYAYTWSVGLPDAPAPEPLGPADLVDEAARLGHEVCQLADNVPVAALDGGALKALRAHAAARGVELELGGRGLSAASLAHHVQVAGRLGTGMLRFVIDGPGHEPAVAEVVAVLRQACDALQAAGVTVALENHDRLTAHELAALVEEVDSDRVGVCLDTVNSIGSGQGLAEVVEVLAPLTVNLHVKDFSIRRRRHGMGFQVEGACLGRGMLDLGGLLEAVGRHGRCGTAVLEQWAPERSTPPETVALEREWVQEASTVLRRAVAARRPTPQHQGAR